MKQQLQRKLKQKEENEQSSLERMALNEGIKNISDASIIAFSIVDPSSWLSPVDLSIAPSDFLKSDNFRSKVSETMESWQVTVGNFSFQTAFFSPSLNSSDSSIGRYINRCSIQGELPEILFKINGLSRIDLIGLLEKYKEKLKMRVNENIELENRLAKSAEPRNDSSHSTEVFYINSSLVFKS